MLQEILSVDCVVGMNEMSEQSVAAQIIREIHEFKVSPFQRHIALKNLEKAILAVLATHQQELQDFCNWLKDNEWRGISSELIDEFKDRFGKVLGGGVEADYGE